MSIARGSVAFGVSLFLCASLVVLQQRLDRFKRGADEPDLTLPSGRFLKVAVLGYRQLTADFFWVKATLYIGDPIRASRGYPQLYALTDLVTDLDPGFRVPYQAAGITLSVYAGRPAESARILEKGMREHPDYWVFPFYAGFNYFYHLHDYFTAARFLEQASAMPGRPAYLPSFVSRLYAQAGRPETALEFLARMYERTQDAGSREALRRRMNEVIVERDLRALEQAVTRYRQRHGRPPARLDELVNEHMIAQIPREPFGGSYRLDPKTGAVETTTPMERLRVHRPPP